MANFTGTSAADMFEGTSGNDTVEGMGGNDVLNGNGGDDLVRGGDGDDIIGGGNGNDIVGGGVGVDLIDGGDGNDSLYGGAGNDHVTGGSGADYIIDEVGHNLVEGGDGDDSIIVNSGDVVLGGDGDDQITIQSSDTQFVGSYDGGAGTDHLFVRFVDISGSVLTSIESIEGGFVRVTAPQLISVGRLDGSFILTTGGSVDMIDVAMRSGINFDLSGATLLDLSGAQFFGPADFTFGALVRGSADGDIITATAFQDILGGGDGNDWIIGGAGNDEIYGAVGNDRLVGGRDEDLMIGGGGDDYYFIDNVGDVVTELAGEGIDTVEASIGTTLGDNVENLKLVNLADGVAAIGNGLNNVIDARAQSQAATLNIRSTLYGMDGNDVLIASNNGDTLIGGAGADVLTGGNGQDTLIAGDYLGYNQSWDGGLEKDILSGGGDVDVVFAGLGDDADGGYSIDHLYYSFAAASAGVTIGFSDLLGPSPHLIAGGTVQNFELLMGLQGTWFNDYISADIVQESPIVFRVYSGDGDDVILTNANQLYVEGGAGNDRIVVGSGRGYFIGGDGIDTVDFSQIGYGISFRITPVAPPIDFGFLTPYYDVENVVGSALGDDIAGDEAANGLAGGAGADRLSGEAGSDWLSAAGVDAVGNPTDDMGAEKDVLSGGEGGDILYAGIGDDVDGGADYDMLAYSFGGATSGVDIWTASFTLAPSQIVAGGTIQNVEQLVRLRGSELDDRIGAETQAAVLVIDAGGGNDSVTSNASSVTLYGGAGNDYLISGTAADLFDGGDGTDTVDYSRYATGVTVALGLSGATGSGAGGDTLRRVENVTGSAQNDIIAGNEAANSLIGGAGNDALAGGRGNDRLTGGTGADRLAGGAGDDQFLDVDGSDVIVERANDGIDTVLTRAGALTLAAHVEKLVFVGTGGFAGRGNDWANVIDTTLANGNDVVKGYGGADLLRTGDGADLLDGGTGADQMIGGRGDDIYIVDRTDDVVTELANEGTDGVYAAASYSIATVFVENLTLTGDASVDATGNSLYNILTGNDGNNVLDGRGGSDRMTGGSGQDQFRFTTALSAGNIDQIVDFSVADDSIGLARSIFAAAGPAGVLAANAFAIGTAASDAFDRIIYDSGTGKLFYDADGVGGVAAVQFATIGTGLALTNADFMIL